jgi:hypothetical protein
LNKSELFRNKTINSIQQLNCFSFFAKLLYAKFKNKIAIEFFGPLEGSLVVKILKKIKFDKYLLTDGKDIIDSNSDNLLYIGHLQSSQTDEIIKPSLEKKWLKNFQINTRDITYISYMSHFSKFKGILDIFTALTCMDVSEQKRIKFRIANNNIRREESTAEHLETFKQKFAGQIEIYEKVNAFKFLKETDIYVYPFHEVKGTFNVPLTLLEAALSGAFPIGPNFSNVICWIGSDFTVNPSSPNEIISMIRKVSLLNSEEKINILKKINESIIHNVEFVDNTR